MKVKVKSIKEIREIGIKTAPDFITDYMFDSIKFIARGSKHSMEYYCDKVIELDNTGHFDGWLWARWMYNKIETPLLEVEE